MPRPVANPPNRFARQHVEWLDEPPSASLELFEEECRSALSRNDSPDLFFRYSVNPYRGCLHACAYCYARPTHQYLGWGAGTDFDRKIVVKTNVAEVLRAELARGEARGETVVLSGNTDGYQGLEASYELTRRCLEVCLEAGSAVSVVTKSALVARDADLLGELARGPGAEVYLSVPFANDDDARAIEPWASRPTRRFEALAALSAAGVPTGVSVAPLIPGLNEPQLPEILSRAAQAGASRASMTLLRLPAEVREVFFTRLEEALPSRAGKIRRAIEDVRGAQASRSAFGSRMRGEGPRWEAARQLFELHARRLGLETRFLAESFAAGPEAPRARPAPRAQLPLFPDERGDDG